MLHISDKLSIPLREFDFDFVRSSGPGGQHVNKVSTKAVLRWSVLKSSLPQDVRGRFADRYRRRINKDGEFILTSQRFRDRGRNIADCLGKLQAMLLEVAEAPLARKRSKPTKSSVARRLRQKQLLSVKKRQRKKPTLDD